MSGLVLVIEDEVDLATTLEYNLRSEGFQVRLAHSGRQGLAAATAEPVPELLVRFAGSNTVTPAGMPDRFTRMRVALFACPGTAPESWFVQPAGVGDKTVCDSVLVPY